MYKVKQPSYMYICCTCYKISYDYMYVTNVHVVNTSL